MLGCIRKLHEDLLDDFLISSFRRVLYVVWFLLGHSARIYLPMKMEQSVLKCRRINSRRRGITQKKAYNMLDDASLFQGMQHQAGFIATACVGTFWQRLTTGVLYVWYPLLCSGLVSAASVYPHLYSIGQSVFRSQYVYSDSRNSLCLNGPESPVPTPRSSSLLLVLAHIHPAHKTPNQLKIFKNF
jgi:hypothetical protein